MRVRVHCCACLRNGERKPDGTCRFCGSEDTFVAKELIQGEIERQKTGAGAALWSYVLDEWERLEKARKP